MSEPEISITAGVGALPPAPDPPPRALTCGEQLKAAREQRGLTLADVAQRLKYAARQVQALEEGRFDALPGLTLQRGFLRGYARLVGLDANNLVLLLECETGHDTGPTTTQLQQIAYAPATLPERSEHTTAWPWILAMLLAVVGIGGYTLYTWEPPIGARAPAAATGVATSAGQVGQHRQGAAAPATAQPATLANAGAASDTGVLNAPAGSGAASKASGELVIPLPRPVADIVPPGAGATATVSGKIRLRFSGESWVEVRQGDGTLVHSGLSASGAEQWVDGQAPFDLVIGNARVVKLQYRGADVNLEPYTKGPVAKVQLK